MSADPITEVVAAGPAATVLACLAIVLVLAGVGLTVHTRPWTSAGVLAAGVAVLGLLAAVTS